jgi:hypothetical protein
MASITTLLVVLTLTGEPVVKALCIAWCDTSSETMNCVEAIAHMAQPETTMTVPECAVVTTAPFLTEEGRAGSRIAVVATTAAPRIGPDLTRLSVVLARRGTTDGRPVPPLVLRR